MTEKNLARPRPSRISSMRGGGRKVVGNEFFVYCPKVNTHTVAFLPVYDLLLTIIMGLLKFELDGLIRSSASSLSI